jgi:hypothetical protein
MTLYVLQYEAPTQEAAQAWIAERTGQLGTPAVQLIQSLEKLQFGALPAGFQLDREFDAGRIFGPAGEIRWWKSGEAFHLWLISEHSQPGAQELRVKANECRYYLCAAYGAGSGYGSRNLFAPFQKHFDWIRGGAQPGHEDRPYVEGFEYFAEPGEAYQSYTDLEADLAQPRVIASRLCAVDFGRDPAAGNQAGIPASGEGK